MLVAGLISGFFSRRVGIEVGKMKRGIDELRRGRYEYRIRTNGKDEIGTAQDCINEFAEYLEAAKRHQAEVMRVMEASKKEAEVAAVSKSDFLGAMSHEIRTPMNGILGSISLLGQSKLDSEQKDLVNVVTNSCESLVHIINGILDLNKLDTSKTELEIRPMEVESVVESVGELFVGRCHEKGIELIYDLDPRVDTTVYGDKERVKQILTNLVNNALKFTDRGHITIQTRMLSRTNAAPAMQYRILDTGIGIDADKLETIFEPFQQADLSTTRKYGGTGLGLAISRKLCELMEGSLTVESEPGRGSTFIVELPLRLVPVQSGDDKGRVNLEEMRRRPVELLCGSGALGEVLNTTLSRHGLEVQMLDWQSLVHGTLKYDDQILVIDWLKNEEEAIRDVVLRRAQQGHGTVVLCPLGRSTGLPVQEGSCLELVTKPVREKDLVLALKKVANGEALETEKPATEESQNADEGDAPAPPSTTLEAPVTAEAINEVEPASTSPEPVKPVSEAPVADSPQPVVETIAAAPAPAAACSNDEGLSEEVLALRSLSKRHPAKVLMVEDNPMNQKIVSMMLTKLGYKVDVANNGKEGLDAVVNTKDYDLIFMDLHMPVMDGLEATRQIRGTMTLEKQPVIVALTGYALDGVQEKCEEAGMNHFLTKPVSVDDLKDAIETVYAQKKAA